MIKIYRIHMISTQLLHTGLRTVLYFPFEARGLSMFWDSLTGTHWKNVLLPSSVMNYTVVTANHCIEIYV